MTSSHNQKTNVSADGKSPKKTVVIILTGLALLVLAMAIMYTRSAIEAKKSEKRPEQPAPAKLVVHYLPIKKSNFASQVSAFGEAKPHYSLDLNSDIGGKVTFVSQQFAVGQRVRKGQLLVKVAQADYQSIVASRQSVLAQAKLHLLEEKRKRKQAKIEWKASGVSGQPTSELVFRGPQIKTAQAAIKDARLALIQSQQDVKKTSIYAPFDAVVISRNVQPGTILQVGANIAKLNSTDKLEITIPLSTQQWSQLPNRETLLSARWPVTISMNTDSIDTSSEKSNVQNNNQWQGYITRISQTVDENTRQRSLVVALDNPLDQKNPLYAGSFVKVRVDGRMINDLLEIPLHALSQAGDIWLLDTKNCLVKQPITMSYSRNNAIYLPVNKAALKTDNMRVVLSPLNSFIQGMCVDAKLSVKKQLLNNKKIQGKAKQTDVINHKKAISVQGSSL